MFYTNIFKTYTHNSQLNVSKELGFVKLGKILILCF